MKIYTASASYDYGHIYYGKEIRATNFRVAMYRAAADALALAKGRGKRVTNLSLNLKIVGTAVRAGMHEKAWEGKAR